MDLNVISKSASLCLVYLGARPSYHPPHIVVHAIIHCKNQCELSIQDCRGIKKNIDFFKYVCWVANSREAAPNGSGMAFFELPPKNHSIILPTGTLSQIATCVKYVRKQSIAYNTLNTNVITGLGMCKVCTAAVDCVALLTRTLSQVWSCVKYVPKQSIA